MRRPAHAIAITLTVVSCLFGSLALATDPTPDAVTMPLTAVSKRESYVYASTPDGLFRAPLETKRWERLKTPPELPPNGTFAGQPGRSPLVIYVALRPQWDHRPRHGCRYGLYLSHDDGTTWELVSERDDFGATLLHPSGALFAVTGDDGANKGSHLLRSPDLGTTWRDITGTASAQFVGLDPDPDHPGLVRIHAWSLRSFMLVADDENYRWKVVRKPVRTPGRRPSDEFFSRDSSTTTTSYTYAATLANYFDYDFGDLTHVPALEVVPHRLLFRFTRGARVVVPFRVVFHYDPEVALYYRRKAMAEGRDAPVPAVPHVKFADQPGGTDFWGLRVESHDAQLERLPEGRNSVTTTVHTTADGKTFTSTYQPPRVKYRVVKLGPSSPYDRELDLGRITDFSRPGEYRVQIIYSSGGHPDEEKGEWDGAFTSPVFTVIIRQ